jgi:hypothetical protein
MTRLTSSQSDDTRSDDALVVADSDERLPELSSAMRALATHLETAMAGMAPDDVVIEVESGRHEVLGPFAFTRLQAADGMTALLPRDVVVDILSCVRRHRGVRSPVEDRAVFSHRGIAHLGRLH